MKRSIPTLAFVLLLTLLAGPAIAETKAEPAPETESVRPSEEMPVQDREANPVKQDRVDTEPSSWSNVKALWG